MLQEQPSQPTQELMSAEQQEWLFMALMLDFATSTHTQNQPSNSPQVTFQPTNPIQREEAIPPTITPKRRKSTSIPMSQIIKFDCIRTCSVCGVQNTPMWRRGAQGEILCNKCGLKWKRATKRHVRETSNSSMDEEEEGITNLNSSTDTYAVTNDNKRAKIISSNETSAPNQIKQNNLPLFSLEQFWQH